MLALDKSFLREYGVTMPILAVAGISGPYNFYPFEYDEVRDTFGEAPNPEGTQPVNLVTAGRAADAARQRYHRPDRAGGELPRRSPKSSRTQGIWVTEKYYDGFGHMEPVIALGSMWRWRMPILADVTEFFQRFGAFPSGTPRPLFTPEPPVAQQDPMTALIAQMDAILAPISMGRRDE